jgi:hypothetical protein
MDSAINGQTSLHVIADGSSVFVCVLQIVKYWPEKGKSGFIVWRYLLGRDDPVPAPWTKEGEKRAEQLGLTMPVWVIALLDMFQKPTVFYVRYIADTMCFDVVVTTAFVSVLRYVFSLQRIAVTCVHAGAHCGADVDNRRWVRTS